MDTALQYLLGAGIAGVLLAQIITTVRSIVGDSIARRRERKGLLRLLYTEVAQNEGNIAYVAAELDRSDTVKGALAMRGRYVNAEVWKAARVSLAQSIPSDEFAVLSDYYKNVLLLEEVATVERGKKDRDAEHETSSDTIYKTKPLLQALQQRGSDVRTLIRNRVPDVTASDRYAELVQKQVLPDPPYFGNRQ